MCVGGVGGGGGGVSERCWILVMDWTPNWANPTMEDVKGAVSRS